MENKTYDYWIGWSAAQGGRESFVGDDGWKLSRPLAVDDMGEMKNMIRSRARLPENAVIRIISIFAFPAPATDEDAG